MNHMTVSVTHTKEENSIAHTMIGIMGCVVFPPLLFVVIPAVIIMVKHQYQDHKLKTKVEGE